MLLRSKFVLAALILVVHCACMFGAPALCNPRIYGAHADGLTKDTLAIQHAIDNCERRGGGIVELTAGTYLSAPIILKSRITLQLDEGAVLRGSPDHNDYQAITLFRRPGRQSLVSAANASHITIRGQGTIDGSGQSWWQEKGESSDNGPRPKLVVFDNCDDIRLEGVTIANSPNWHVVLYYSHHIVIHDVKILAPAHSPNTDAIDPFASSDIEIDHVTADVGDDNVAIKSGEPGSPGPDDASRNIAITDCTFLHGHGLSVGSEVAGGVQHVHVSRVHFEGTNNGIRIKSGRDRGNDLSDLVYSDLTMVGVHTAIQITDYYGDKTRLGAAGVQPAPVTRLTPHMHNITIENVKATGIATAMDIEGLPEAPITMLTLQNIHIESDTGAKVFYAEMRTHDLSIHSHSGPPMVAGTGVKDLQK